MYKAVFEIHKTEKSIPFFMEYTFACDNGKKAAMQAAIDVMIDYIIENNFYVGNVKFIKEL